MPDRDFNPRLITTEAERLFLYRNSAQICAQTGFQGHLRGDFENGGEFLFTTFFPCKNPFDEGFSDALQVVVDSLRNDGCLQSFRTMRNYCFTEAAASRISSRWGRDEYAFRVDHAGFSFLFRLLPYMGDYHFYVWCYRTDWLNQHMEKAWNGIRFVDTCGNDLFRLADGGRFRLESTLADEHGAHTVSAEITARYVDDYHLELPSYAGNSVYHIAEYAELLESEGKVPKPSHGELRSPEREVSE